MLKKSIIYGLIFLSVVTLQGVSPIYSDTEENLKEPEYTKLRDIDKGTFNEYRYRLTEQYFKLREKFQIDGTIDKNILGEMASIAEKGYKYLPDNLSNKNLYNNFLTEIARGIKYPENEANYTSVVKALQTYVEEVKIDSMKGTIEVSPDTGNAPLTVTLRAKVTDPTGTKIPDYNYVWWIDNGGKKEIIGRKLSMTYIIKEEGKTSIFLDVVSNHKNEAGYTDVLPFSSRKDIDVREKVASLIIKVNGEDLRGRDTIKFNPDDSGYGLIFDATSSTPTSGTKFISTKWNFGNGVKREYDGSPKIERITYKTEGEFTVTLILKTNELKTVERKFVVSIHKPIASINVASEEGFIGDKFSFKAKAAGNDANLTYDWEVIDITNDKVVLKKEGNVVAHTFLQKGKYNVKLHVVEPSGDDDIDSKIIYINSRPPVAEFQYKIPKAHKPNTVFLDATRSHDPDFSDDGKLTYSWIINGVKANLEDGNEAGSIGYYTFGDIGEHSVSLEVTDPDGISSLKTQKVSVKSVLSLDYTAYPRVVQREQFIKFVAESQNADFFEWDFGDGAKEGGDEDKISHTYEKSGMFDVKLTVRDKEGNTNAYIQKVYVGDSGVPLAFITLTKGASEVPEYKEGECSGNPAYMIDKVDTIKFDAGESIDIDGDASGLGYSWKIGNEKFATTKSISHKFDELGCFPIKLTVTSDKNGKSHTVSAYVKVINKLPELGSLNITMVDPNADPVVVNVVANGAKDPDGVIQSYLWYYYTDMDSDPQDFRSTTKNSTTFVLPKITGNYFFVLVMKDNSDARISSEEIGDSKYSLTLSGDNVNTPLIDLNVSDTAVSIGDEVSFTANVKNILGKDIAADSEFFWDFDGDGFYDKETKEATTVYKYTKSGEYFAKVKVKHKGFSNVRNTPVAVSNKLFADFEYIAIGNKFIFISKSAGKVDDFTWDLGDGNRIIGKEYVEHTYTDKNTSHVVKLKIAEGSKTKEVEKKVVSNPKNILKSKKEGINVFSSPEYDNKNEIILENQEDRVHVYLGTSKGDIKKYAIDYDTTFDSDVNGTKDDDIENLGTPSISNGSVAEIILNANKEQIVRIFTLTEADVVLDSFEIKIIKNYITQEEAAVGEIVFEGITQEEKALLDELKKLVDTLPAEYKKEATLYVKRLQEEYNDDKEKAKVIIDFEGFLDNDNIKNANQIIDILEQIIAFGQEDDSEKGIAHSVLVSLIPENIVCSGSGTTESCKDFLISQLNLIKESSDIEQNKKTGAVVLEIIGATDTMTSKEKLDFKAVLKTLVYGGVSNIPEDEKKEVEDTPTTTDSSEGSLMGILKYVLYGVGALFGILILFGVAFYAYYKLSSSDGEMSFQDFISNKTGAKAKEETLIQTDVLGSANDTPINTENQTPKQATDPLAPTDSTKKEDTNIPDWLKGAAAPVVTQEVIESPKVEDILVDNTSSQEKLAQAETEVSTQVDAPVMKETSNLEEVPTPLVQESTSQVSPGAEDLIIPDWLKGSAIEETPKQADVIPNPLDITAPVDSDIPGPLPANDVVDLDNITQVEDLQVPDWLKGSLDAKTETIDTSKGDEFVQEETPVVKKEEKSETKGKAEAKKTTAKKTPKKDDKTTKVSESKAKKADDLWQDGMEIPDWLKDTGTSDDKSSKKS